MGFFVLIVFLISIYLIYKFIQYCWYTPKSNIIAKIDAVDVRSAS